MALRSPLWIEDVGRWFAGPDGRPARAPWHHGASSTNDTSGDPGSPRLDDLTGEMNRRQFTDLLADTLHDASRLRTSFATLVVSIDDLARINEAYGFAVGDEVISAVARRLRALICAAVISLDGWPETRFGLTLRNCTPHDLRLAGEAPAWSPCVDEVILTRTRAGRG